MGTILVIIGLLILLALFISLFGYLCVVLGILLGCGALIGFIVAETSEGRVVAGVLGGLALPLFVIGGYAVEHQWGHQGPRGLTHSPRANSPSARPPTGLRYDVVDGIFVREYDLENFLVTNWDRLDFGTPLEFVAQQVPCGNLGIIDILARDRVTHDYVVIEIKKGEADDVVFGQISRYLGGIQRAQATIEGVGVRGIIVAHSISSRLRAAAFVNPKVGLRKYVWDSNGESRANLTQGRIRSRGNLLVLPGSGEQLERMCGPAKRKTSPLAGALAFLFIIAACAGLYTGVFNLGNNGSRPVAGSHRNPTGESALQAAVDKPSARPTVPQVSPAKSPPTARVGSAPKSSRNMTHDLLVEQPDEERNQTLTVFMKESKENCDFVELSFFQGFDESRSAFWNVACRNGRLFAVMVYNDATGSKKVLDCADLKVVAGVECFKKF